MKKKNILKKAGVFAIILFFVGASVTPNIIRNVRADPGEIFYPTDDAPIYCNGPNDNAGSSPAINVRNMYGHPSHPTYWELDALVKFDISSIPSDSTINSATLKLYYYYWKDSNPAGHNLKLYRATSSWNENTVTWNTQPSWASSPTAYATVPSSTGVWMEWDVTGDVQDFVDGQATNYGWKITDEYYWGSYDIPITYFRAKEYGDYIPYLEVIIENQPPVADADGPYTINEGDSLPLDASASNDPDGDPLTYSWDLDNDVVYGDVTGETPTVDWTTLVSFGLDDDGTYIIGLEVDDSQATDTITTTVEILNVAPTITSLNLTVDPVPINTTVNLAGTFTDPGWLDTHTATIDWDDGNTTTGDITGSNGSFTATDSWSYAQAGVYTITLTVTDDDGGSGTEIFQYVVVYNSDDGFVTGGGWINSPEGAYTPNPNLTGKANFGFVSKYKKGQQQPTGNTEFNFKVADLNFHSSSYDWLVIAGAKAMYKGTGTINNAGNYGFLLSAIDEELTPSTDVDLFRIKIWDKDNNDEVIYDNMLGEEEDAEPTTEIGGGNIKIHTG